MTFICLMSSKLVTASFRSSKFGLMYHICSYSGSFGLTSASSRSRFTLFFTRCWSIPTTFSSSKPETSTLRVLKTRNFEYFYLEKNHQKHPVLIGVFVNEKYFRQHVRESQNHALSRRRGRSVQHRQSSVSR